FVAYVVNYVERVVADFGDDRFEGLVARFPIAVEDRVALLALPAIRDDENREPLVFGRPHVIETLRMRGVLINRLVLGLSRPDLGTVDLMVLVFGRKLVPFPRLGVTAVIKTVALPSQARSLHPFHRVGQDVARRDFHHVVFLPVGAAERNAVGRVLAVFRKREGAEPRRAVLRPLVRIDQYLRLAVQTLLNVDHVLVLQPVVLGEEIKLALTEWRADLRVIVKLRQPPLDLRAVWNLFQVSEGQFVLLLDPFGGLLGVVVLEPAVWIGDFGPVIVVDLIDFSGFRIFDRFLRSCREWRDNKRKQNYSQRRNQGLFHLLLLRKIVG